MEKTDILVIGGSAAGIVAATTSKAFHKNKKVILVRKEEKVLVPCGIPYIFGSLDSSDQNVIPDAALSNAGVELKINEAVSLDKDKKICRFADGEEIAFEKAVIATGSVPAVHAWLVGADLGNVFTVAKDKNYLDQFSKKLADFKKIVVLGGGFIGIEVADELNKIGKDVTIVEMLPHVLSLAFDPELACEAQELLKARGICVRSNSKVKELSGAKQVEKVVLSDGETIDADAVILATGYKPCVSLAAEAGLQINKMGFIEVNEYMHTSHKDIFAVGDCAEKHGFITRALKGTMLASAACAEARIAGMNLYKLSTLRSFSGNISIFCTCIGDTAFGAAGVTETLANERGFNICCGTFEGIDKHPGTLPGTHKQVVKLIVDDESGVILGGEVLGGCTTGELINMIGLMIQNRMTVSSLLTFQIGTQPLLTAPPTAYPLIKAAEAVVMQSC
ncbi:MAG: pyridine nucleotide-disulfide oxidoreductase [Desulfobacteraceae bacterium 4572_35.1]|nr:MAG: pyridine nucleotide-disulfide oxidoreductase [Desulfobacteraceae bacterium 4572_35.1]